MVSYFNVKITREKLECLRPCEWLNDEVINFYFKLLQERSEKSPGLPQCWFTNSFFWEKLSGGAAVSNAAYSYGDVRRWTVRAAIDIFAMDYVVIPMNIGEMHWALSIMDFRTSSFRYMDSMRCPPCENLEHYLRRYLEDEHVSKKGAPFVGADAWHMAPVDPQLPQQDNGFDCGVFTCFYADFFSAGQAIEFGQFDIPALRARLAARILRAGKESFGAHEQAT